MRKMKNSGIDWIGQIPSDWDTKKCKYITTFINGFPFESERLKSEYLYPVIRISDIQDGSISLDDCLGIDSNYGLASYLIKNGDILLAMSGATVGKVGIVKGDVSAYINQRVGIIRTGCPSFLFYCLSTKNFVEYVMLMSAGTAQPNISTKGFGEYPVPFPSIDEQQKIADFLDEKCGEIDSIRTDVQREIEILNDYKKSVITEAVTKGLNPKAKLKDSGIEWIGKIPEDWELSKIGSIYSLRTQKVSDKNFAPLSVTMKGVLPQLENVAKTDDGDNRKLVRKGDFVINSRSDRRGSCGISALDGSVSLINLVLKPRTSMNPRYYNWLFHTDSFADEFYSWGHGIVDDLWTTRWQEMRNISVPVPSLSEQKAIADYLDEKCSEIDAAIADKQKQLETLDEYKKSLIFEYVTGKKEVS